jgi:hypothetical protein
MPGVYLPDSPNVDYTVVVSVATYIRSHLLLPQESPESVSAYSIAVQAIARVAYAAAVSVWLWVGGLVSDDKDHRLRRSGQVIYQPTV